MASSKDVEAGLAESPPPPYNAEQGGPVMDYNQAPPNYSATVTADDLAPPPSYDSLFGKVKAAKQESDGNVDFCRKILIILCSTLGCTVMLAVVLAVPISMIVIGATYKDDCPAERMIPIYLIVAGSFGIVKNLSSLCQRFKNKDDEDAAEKNAKTTPFDATLNCFLLAWFIAGNVWIYRTYGEWNEDRNSDQFCDPTLYRFAFWVTTATYILIGTVCCCTCIAGILAGCCEALKE